MKTLITYVHYSREGTFHDSNVNFFTKCGIIDSGEYQYNFVINSQKCNINIPQFGNVNVISGRNDGYDFGGYAQSLETVDINQFDRFIFINDTCRGPFIPEYIPSNLSWIDMFFEKLSDKVKMVGPTWNTDCPAFGSHPDFSPHIQSYCFGTDRVGIDIMKKHKIFDFTAYNSIEGPCRKKTHLIVYHEIGMSRAIIEEGFEIKPFLLSQHIDAKHGCVCQDVGLYFFETPNPLEVMFYKTTQSTVRSKIFANYTDWLLSKKQQ